MNKFNQNYEKIRTLLQELPKVEKHSYYLLKIQEVLGLNEREVLEVLNAMKEDQDVVFVDDVMYVINEENFRVGSLRVVRGNFAFVGVGENAVYVAHADFGDALDQDEVLVEMFYDTRPYGKVIAILKRNRTYLLGTMKQVKNKLVFDPYDGKIPNNIEFDNNNTKVLEGQRIIGKIRNVHKGVIDVILDSVLGMHDEPGMDVLSVLYSYDLETTFNEAVIEASKHIPETVDSKDYEGRIDHRNQYVITVDGEDAKDLDDAIYMEALNDGYRLYVHIADVSHYVREGDVFDVSAYGRTSSIYMVDRVVPMLPTQLSNGICSLHPNVDRLTLTCKMDIDFGGEIYNYEVYPSVIHSHQRLSYNQVNQRTDLGNAEHMIEMMLDCASRLQYKRDQAGSIGFESDESQFLVNAKGEVLDIFVRSQGEGEKMIESFMVSANESVAKLCKYQEIPILYRVHDKPDKDKMQALSHTLRILGYRLRGNLDQVHPQTIQKALQHFENTAEFPIVSRLMLRSMSKAKYAPLPEGHFGLALEDYTHFTSPIRRYPDLLLHQRLKTYVFNPDFSKYDEHVRFAKDAGEHISSKERQIMEAEREVEKIKKAEYMVDKVGESYEGMISGISNYGFFVELSNTVEGVVPLRSLKDDFYTYDAISQKLIGERTKNVYTLGQKVTIKVVEVDRTENEVVFALKKKKQKKVNQHDFKRRKKQKSVS